MRYIGSKENLLPFIEHTVAAYGLTGGVFGDLFAGTTVVGRHFKRLGYQVLSNDLMAYSFAFGKAYIENNAVPGFAGLVLPRRPQPLRLFDLDTTRLEEVLAYLNALPPVRGFMFAHYCDEGTAGQEHPRMYFSAANAGRIDAIRACLADWSAAGTITESEFYILLAALLEAIPGVSNTTGTYGAFLKYWEARSQKTLALTVPPLVPGRGDHRAYRQDANALARAIACDVLYLDPPYNGRQYATNYHILETVARWDAPVVYGKSGLRPYEDAKSVYCRQDTALRALHDLACHACCRLFLLSYNSEGIMPHEAICEVLRERGRLEVREQSYRRFRSDSDHARRQYRPDTHISERIYIVHTP